jgi:hypothetical protein
MSAFYDLASLVLVPSGTKAQKIYAQKPMTTDGQLAFTRSTTATRVGPDGLIEKVRTNTYLYSNTFTDAAWTNVRMNFTAAAAANPLTGTSDAFKAIPDTNSGIHAIRQTIVYGVLSIYAKKGENEKIGFRDDGDTGFYATFNLNTGVLIEKSASALASITALSGGWYRVQFAVPTSSSKLAGIYFLDNAYTSGSPVSNNYAGNGTDGLFIYASQAETGDIATDYIATTTAAVSVGPVANVPRLDYLGSSCPRLILEGQRVNLAQYSEAFGTASYWFANNATITSNSVVSPDGYTNADTYTAAGASNYLNGSATSVGSNTVTYSVFAKAGTSTAFRIREAFYFGTSTVFNLSTGTVTSGTGTITNYGNGWYRCTHTQAYGVGETSLSWSYDLNTASSGTAYIYGAQAEVGAYATSYIPTLGAAVTRGADAASKTGISSLIGQTEGTLFVEFVVDSSSSPTMAFFVSAAGVFDNAIWIQQNASDSVIFRVFSGTTAQCSITKTGLTNGQTVKIAGAYKANDFVLYVNGVQVGTDNSGTIPSSLSQLEIGSYAEVGSPYNQNRPVSQALLFPTRLSNADLAALTA